jgi:4-amino-4-deoxy-L-arabinose transferase-like glycosyltransferase
MTTLLQRTNKSDTGNTFFDALQARWLSDFLILALTFGFVYLHGIGKFSLIEPDEGRYAEIPREMLELGDYLTPHLNYVKYFEKPPLLYWLNALSMKLFGINEFAARFTSALCGVAVILFVYYLGRKLLGRATGIAAAVILGSCVCFMIQSRINNTDMLLTLCLTISLGSFMLAAIMEQHRAAHAYIGYIATGLAVLTKGLIGIVFPVAIVGMFICLARRWHLLKELRIFPGASAFLLVSAPWFIFVSLKHPEFFSFFFIHEHFERYLTTVHHHYQPFWFFMPILLVGMMPWSILIPVAWLHAWRQRTVSIAGDSRLFLLIWATLLFVFFSISKSKLIPYILPLYPVVALLIADMLVNVSKKMPAYIRRSLVVMGGGTILVGVVTCFAAPYVPNMILSQSAGLLLGGLMSVQGGTVLWSVWKQDISALFPGVAIPALLIMLVGVPAVSQQFAELRGLKRLGETIRQKIPHDSPVISQGLRQGLSFYARRRIIILESPGEIAFGFKHSNDGKWLISRQQFLEMWHSDRQIFAVIRYNDLKKYITSSAISPTVYAVGQKFIIVSNR